MTHRHLLTISLEDYFHVGAFRNVIHRDDWYRFETRLEPNTLRTLDMLDRHEIKATFFVLGWIADQRPDLVREVARRGHEIGASGYFHRPLRGMSREEFRADVLRSREALERAGGQQVLGYRVADGWFGPGDLWALKELATLGFRYDSSLLPWLRSFRNEPWRRFVHRLESEPEPFWEVPLSTAQCLAWRIPIAGGNYFRQFPRSLVRRAVARWDRTHSAPYVMYFHVWEIDAEQPRIGAASARSKLRHYRNLGRMQEILEGYFKTYAFGRVADHLQLRLETSDDREDATQTLIDHDPPTPVAPVSGVREEPGSESRPAVTIVVPCFNEESVVAYLGNTLASVERSLAEDYDVRFVLVDDCSTDDTWDSLSRTFGGRPNYALVRHQVNRGVAGAISTGIQHAQSEIVCSIDCDCTYDPHELKAMLPLLSDGVDLVTASPYHPRGAVRNVPAWRLSLSKTSSFLYRRVLRQKLYTYTSCFRVYRRSRVLHLDLREPGFLGVAELIGQLDLQGSTIVEYPATLATRVLGQSKMKVARTIAGHLRLLTRLWFARLKREPRYKLARQEHNVLPAERLARQDHSLNQHHGKPHELHESIAGKDA